MKTQIIFLGLVFALALPACGKAIASGARATSIPVDQSGFTCFLIRDDNGNGVGGSCVKN